MCSNVKHSEILNKEHDIIYMTAVHERLALMTADRGPASA